jgi:E3 ubiquitin-protein ligase TRIP12
MHKGLLTLIRAGIHHRPLGNRLHPPCLLPASERLPLKRRKVKKVGFLCLVYGLLMVLDIKKAPTEAKAPRKSSKKSSAIPPPPSKEDTPQPESEAEDDQLDREDENDYEDEEESEPEPDHEEDSLPRHFSGHGGIGIDIVRNIHGVITRTMMDLRSIMENLRRHDDPIVQRAALEELAQLLLMSNEDTLAGHFSPDQYIKEILPLMEPSEIWGENSEMALVACRCIANMMEALPASTSNIVYGGAVPILCKKLLQIEYIDVAEQALSVSLNC